MSTRIYKQHFVQVRMCTYLWPFYQIFSVVGPKMLRIEWSFSSEQQHNKTKSWAPYSDLPGSLFPGWRLSWNLGAPTQLTVRCEPTCMCSGVTRMSPASPGCCSLSSIFSPSELLSWAPPAAPPASLGRSARWRHCLALEKWLHHLGNHVHQHWVIRTHYSLRFGLIFLRACTPQSGIAKFRQEIIELAQFF